MSHKRKNLPIFGQSVVVHLREKLGNVHVGKVDDGHMTYMIGMNKNLVGSFSGKVCAVIDTGGDEMYVTAPADLYGNDICYECNLRHILGGIVDRQDILYCKFEKTCGAIMFTEKDGERRYLLIKNESGHIGFPKGHVEFGETEEQTAAREVNEETGLDFVRYGSFREEYTYTTRENTIKTGVFFLGHYEYKRPTFQADEIVDDWLLPYDKARVLLNFPEDRELLEKAKRYFLAEEGKRPGGYNG
ncbi:MAG: NUDIX domain-containing protein [Ruminiclostridium sp.]|nr:NUDIX domain-containing protein [Ruminiclostridium sp.]